MNIKDLPQGSYTVEEPQTMNINDLPQGSYTSDSQNQEDQFNQAQVGLAHSQNLVNNLPWAERAGIAVHGAIKGMMDTGTETLKSGIERSTSGVEDFIQGAENIKRGQYGEAAKGFAKGVGKTAEGAVETAGAPFSALLHKPLEGLAKIYDFTQGGVFSKAAEDLQTNHPEAYRAFNDIVQAGLMILGAKGGGEITKSPVELAKEVPGNVAEGAGMAKDTALEGLQTAKKLVTKPVETVKEIFHTKTPEEVLATKPEDVYKLNPQERADYQKTQLEKINKTHQETIAKAQQAHQEIEAKVQADLKSKSETSLQETQNLKSEVDRVSNKEATELKQKAIQVYKNNSAQFERLFNEEFTPEKQNIPLKQRDIIAKLDQEFINDPELNPKEKLDLNPEGKDITAKELYDKVRGLKTSVPAAKGTSTFTSNDLAINRTRGVLSETLRENGIDLKNANKFWSEWKPLQREITAKVKPFEPGYKTGTMAKILRDSASELGDAKNAKFIADFESQLGEKIGTETRTAMEKLSTAQKQALVDKIDSEIKISDAKVAKESAIRESKSVKEKAKSELEMKSRVSESQARHRTVLKNIVRAGLGWLGLDILKKTTGFSIVP